MSKSSNDLNVCCICPDCDRTSSPKKCKLSGMDVSKNHMMLNSPSDCPKRVKK